MSLDRTYRLRCDGITLAAHLGLLNNVAVCDNLAIFRNHDNYGPRAGTSTKARSLARKDGWVRHSRTLPVLASQPSAGTSVHKFDLCPGCAHLIKL